MSSLATTSSAVTAATAKGKRTPAQAVETARPAPLGEKLKLPEPKPWPESVDGAVLLEELAAAFRRYLALPGGAAEALALWVLFTHTFNAWQVSPRLALTSPAPRCGKTTALSILACLVPRPLLASNITPAAVYRVIELNQPTLLIDEADTYLGRHEEFRGILNSGHARLAAYVVRCHGDNHEPRCFSTWGPIAVAKIGELPATLQDRSIEIRMQRRRPDEKVERFRSDRTAHLTELARKAARWAKDHIEALRKADPNLPDGLHDRAADNWRPLIAIADLAGGPWPESARTAANRLSGDTEDPDIGVRLLSDIRIRFKSKGVDRLPSKDLCQELGGMTGRPWADWNQDFCITENQLARLVKEFRVRPKGIRVGDKTPRGYKLADFDNAFARYLPCESATPQQPNEINELEEPSPATGADDVADK